MSLSKQLGLGFFVVLLLVFVGSLWININNTRDFVQQQLQSHAQDTATSLGLSITPYIGNDEDLPIIDTMANVIFDRGYYAAIELRNSNNELLLEKSNPEQLNNVPSWFVKLFPIQAPVSSTELNNGWNIAGNLKVKSNPGFAYRQLWNNAVDTFWVVSGIFLLGLLFVYFLLRVITKPINAVVKNAERISNKNFESINDIPKTPELKAFVVAINKMSEKLGTMFGQLSAQSEKYRAFAYSDQLTQVGNRRAFELAFKQLLQDQEHHPRGFLLMVRLSSLSDVNHAHGNDDGDNYIKAVCASTQATTIKKIDQYAMYRLSGSDFALVIENIEKPKCERIVSALCETYKRIEKSEYTNGTAHVGITEFEYGFNYGDVMEKADSALSIAESLTNRFQFSAGLPVTHSNKEWRVQIDKLLSNNTSDFAAQAINDSAGNTVYSEWFARLPNKNTSELIPMAQLIPASIRLDAAEKIDEMIVSLALQKLSSLPDMSNKIGLNLSRISLLDTEFQNWFILQLSNNSANAQRLVLEIPERALINDTKQLVAFVQSLKALGVKITVERFGAQLAGLRHLRDLKPDYLKVDGRYIRNIQNEPDNQLFVQSLISIAHGLNIKIIAETVESIEESLWLSQSGVDYQQGYFINAPRIV